MSAFPGIPEAKWPRLHGIAEAALAGRLDRSRLRALPYEAALAQIQTIPGMGPFFSQGVLIRGAGLTDAVSDDEVTKQAVQKAYQLRELPTYARVQEIAEAWRPFRAWAMVLLHVWFRREAGGQSELSRGGWAESQPIIPAGMEQTSLTLFGVAIAAYFVSMPLYFVAAGWGRPRLAQAAMALTALGIALHLGSYGLRWAADGHYPLSNMYEYSSQMALLIAISSWPRRSHGRPSTSAAW